VVRNLAMLRKAAGRGNTADINVIIGLKNAGLKCRSSVRLRIRILSVK
jgi:hypothetical protein